MRGVEVWINVSSLILPRSAYIDVGVVGSGVQSPAYIVEEFER